MSIPSSTESHARLQVTPGEGLAVLDRSPELLVLEATYAPGGSPPPAHYHPEQDEHFEMLEGTLRVEVSGEERELRKGDTLDIPRGTSHRMWNPNERVARNRWETRPAGRTEDWFAALAALQHTDHVDANGRPKALAFAALADEYRDTFRLAAPPRALSAIAVRALAAVARATGRAPGHQARELGALSGPIAGIAFVGGIATGIAMADDPYPLPGSKPKAIRRYFAGSRRAARISAAGQLVSTAALARFTMSVARLAEGTSLRAPTTAAGGLAAASLVASASTSLALTSGAKRSDADVTALHQRVFIAGGPVHTAAFGALVACLAVAGRRTGRLPPALTTAGLASGAAGMLSPLGLVAKPAVLLIPAGRLSGLVVCGIAGARLSR